MEEPTGRGLSRPSPVRGAFFSHSFLCSFASCFPSLLPLFNVLYASLALSTFKGPYHLLQISLSFSLCLVKVPALDSVSRGIGRPLLH